MKGPGKPFRILSLDGGGIRGAFIAAFLAEIEKQIGAPISNHFDLIAGTSTGAIIAAGLAVHVPAGRILEMYLAEGPKIFARREPVPIGWFEAKKAKTIEDKYLDGHDIDYDQLLQSKYESKELRRALSEIFGDKPLEEARSRVVIPAVDMTRGQTVVFKTPHFDGLFRDRYYKIVDILMATTAAPTYFPHAVIEKGSAYVDGGLWANNPSMVAIVEAMKISEVANREGKDYPFDLSSIQLLSVGTGKASYFHRPPEGGAGVMWWAPHLLNVSSVSQSQGVNFQVQYALGDRAVRIDYDLPDGTWSLDSVGMLEQMAQIGRQRCFERLKDLAPVFFREAGFHPYHPFPDTRGKS